MGINNKDLKRRAMQISYEHKLSHLGSVITMIDTIEEIYAAKNPRDKFVLSNGHAGLALYVVLEKYGFGNAEELLKKHGIHPNRDPEYDIWVSTGSLGSGLPIAVGMAIARPDIHVYCTISDGECAEGSIWEAIRIAEERKVVNLTTYVNMNGYGAYGSIPVRTLLSRLIGYELNIFPRYPSFELPFLKGVDAHYKVMSKEEYAISQKFYAE